MSRIDILPAEGNWYKANLHCHTTYSDGVCTPAQIKQAYKAAGYSVVAFTDHDYCKAANYFSDLNDKDFLALCGYEVGVIDFDRSAADYVKDMDLNLIAEDPNNAPFVDGLEKLDVDYVNGRIQEFIKAGYIVNYNHPGWSGADMRDFMKLEGITCFEVYNTGCETLTNDGDSRLEYAKFLRYGKKAYPICCDDNHDYAVARPYKYASDRLGGWTVFKAKELTYPAIIDALKKGNFYSSTGPQIFAYYIEDNKICIDCSPVRGIYLQTGRGSTPRLTSNRDELTHFEVDLSKLPKETYKFVRFELADTKNRHAFTVPYYL